MTSTLWNGSRPCRCAPLSVGAASHAWLPACLAPDAGLTLWRRTPAWPACALTAALTTLATPPSTCRAPRPRRWQRHCKTLGRCRRSCSTTTPWSRAPAPTTCGRCGGREKKGGRRCGGGRGLAAVVCLAHASPSLLPLPNGLPQEAYASYFAEPLAPVLQALNDWVGSEPQRGSERECGRCCCSCPGCDPRSVSAARRPTSVALSPPHSLHSAGVGRREQHQPAERAGVHRLGAAVQVGVACGTAGASALGM